MRRSVDSDPLDCQGHCEGHQPGSSRGFTFLGYKIASEGVLDIAPQTPDKFLLRLIRLIRLYEQGASDPGIGETLKRFYQWAYSGLKQQTRERIQWQPSSNAFYAVPVTTLPCLGKQVGRRRVLGLH